MQMAETFKLSNKVSEKSMVSLSVYNVGRQKCAPNYQWGPGVRDHYLIHYISGGCGIYKAGGETWRLSAGDVFLVYPNVEVSYQADGIDPWEYNWVGFAGSDAAAIMDATDFTPKELVLHDIPFGAELKEHLQRINAAFGNSFANAVEMTGELYLTLMLFVKHAGRRASGHNTDAADVRRAIDYIDFHYSYPITVEDIASYTGVSRSTLFREFRECLDLSPKEYLDNYRVRRAAFLLRSSGLSIGSVAASVGYTDALYFSKVFRKKKDMTPTEYRNRKS